MCQFTSLLNKGISRIYTFIDILINKAYIMNFCCGVHTNVSHAFLVEWLIWCLFVFADQQIRYIKTRIVD